MKTLEIATYAALREKIRQTLILGQRKIEDAKVQTYWKTGRLINQYLERIPGKRQERHQQVVARLAKDLELGEKVLYRCLRFAESFPYFSARRNMTWAHYRALIAVPDEKKRLALADQAAKKEWTSRELEIEIRNFLWDERVEASDGKPPSLLPAPTLGPLFTYKILDPATVQPKEKGLLLIDLGFSAYRDLDAVTSKTFKPLDIIESVKTGDDSPGRVVKNSPGSARATKDECQYKLQKSDRTEGDLFTYQATVEKVVDGDTLRVIVDLGFNVRTRQYIRLKGIDCPEMDTQEGVIAKRFVENALRGLELITLKSVRPDKYDRYLGDIIIEDENGRQVYLNNLLLEKGHAVRVRA